MKLTRGLDRRPRIEDGFTLEREITDRQGPLLFSSRDLLRLLHDQ